MTIFDQVMRGSKSAPITGDEWLVLLRQAHQHFNRDPDWSDWSFVSRCLSGHARRKMSDNAGNVECLSRNDRTD